MIYVIFNCTAGDISSDDGDDDDDGTTPVGGHFDINDTFEGHFDFDARLGGNVNQYYFY